MGGEFPGVIDLNVSGTHYRTLLSTLKKDENSRLAAMFTGQIPIHKDKDDRYFIEADGFTFKAILHYLCYDELPFQEAGNYGQTGTGSGFGGGGTRAEGLFGNRQTRYTARNIEMMYKDAMNLGLSDLVRFLEQFQPNFVNNKMEEYRKSIRGYDSCLAEILNIIPAESLFHKTEFTLRIKQDLQFIAEEKCCEHECKMTPYSSFGQPYYTSIDAIVKVPFEVNPTVLSALAIDLQKRGYVAHGQMAVCDFDCRKEVKRSKYVVFAGQPKKCCAEELLLLTFKWDTEANVVSHPGIFGTKPSFGQRQTTGGLFGAQQNTGFSFGSSEQVQSGASLFGRQQGSFGQGLASGLSPTQQQGTVGFGASPQGSFGQNQTSVFGSGQQQGTLGQGSSFGFGVAQQGSFGQNQTSVIASASTKESSIGLSGGQQQQSKFGEQSQQKGFFFAPPATKQQGSGLFGSSSTSQQQTTSGSSANTSLFGGLSTFAGNKTLSFGSGQTGFGQTWQQQTNGTGLGGVSSGSPQKQQSAFAGKGVTPGSNQSKQSSFGKPKNKNQHVFGGTPSFESKFDGLSLQQTPKKPDQSSGSFTTSAVDKSSSIFGKPADPDANIKQQSEPNVEQPENVE